MTQTEKAIQIVMSFEGLVTNWDCFHDVSIDLQDRMPCMKECALICVDEILNGSRLFYIKDYDYWKEVKQEIKKL